MEAEGALMFTVEELPSCLERLSRRRLGENQT